MSDGTQRERQAFQISLRVGEEQFEATANVPTEPIRVSDLLPILQSFDNALVAIATDDVEKQGKKISCRAGCGACCRQLVPLSEAEAHYLAALVAEMPPERREYVWDRFQKTLQKLDETGMLSRLREVVELGDPDERRQLGIEYFQLGIPCPFLEDESCSIHPDRPLTCREYLVTSPAENCKGPRDIEKVPMPAKLSTVVYRLGNGVGRDQVRWVPLVLAIEWAARHPPEHERRFPGAELFQNIIDRLSEK